MGDSQNTGNSVREKLIQLYHERLSKRYKRYYDPESSEQIPPTPAKMLCQREDEGRDKQPLCQYGLHGEQNEDEQSLHTAGSHEDASSSGTEVFSPNSKSHSTEATTDQEGNDDNDGSNIEIEDEVLSDNECSLGQSEISSRSHHSSCECESSDHLGNSDFDEHSDFETEPLTDQDEHSSSDHDVEEDFTVRDSNQMAVRSYHLKTTVSSREGYVPASSSHSSRTAINQEMSKDGDEDGINEDNIGDDGSDKEYDNSEDNEENEDSDDDNGDNEEEECDNSDESDEEEDTTEDDSEQLFNEGDNMNQGHNEAHDAPPDFVHGNRADRVPVRDHFPRQQRKQCLIDLINGDYSEPVDAGTDITRSDLLYMALGTAKQNNFTNKAFNDSVQLLNNIFTAPVLPVSSLRLDSILIDKNGVKLYFYCHSCQNPFGELDYENIKTKLCENELCGAVNKISDLREAHYFVMFDISHAIEVLFNRSDILDKLWKPADAVNKSQPGFISDIHDGTMYRDFARRVSDYTECVISLHFCTDGAPLFKSSKTSIWPIMFCVNELPPVLRMKNILLGGLWFGKSQPPMNLLLVPLSEQAVTLSNGFQILVKNEPVDMRAFIIGCCVDSGARGKVQGIKSHGGYYGCNWCEIKGLYLDGSVKYPMTEECPHKRTHGKMLRLINKLFGQVEEDLSDDERSQERQTDDEYFGVQDASPLINVPMFDMVSGFFVDPMHLLDLGITKAHLVRWLEEPGDFNISDSIDEIDKRLLSLRPPLEFRRMPRKLNERARAKARELNNWLLYCMYPVLCGILPQKYLKLWLFFAQAVYLLSQSVIPYSHVNTADALLKHFIYISQQYYGETCMVFNMHLLTHLAEHVARWGPLWATSAYCFENFNGFLLKIVRSQNGIAHQIIRALSWRQSLDIIEPFVSEKAKHFVKSLTKQRKNSVEVDGCLLLGNSSQFSPSDEERWFCDGLGYDIASCEEYAQLAKNNCVFSKPQPHSKRNNSVAQLMDKSIVLIRKFVHDRLREKVFMFASKVLTESCISMPRGIQLDLSDHCVRKVIHVEDELCCLSSADLKIVCFYSECGNGNFVTPLANVCNAF
ncbi:Halomucin [Frankliniella fusca]|uniref:Halomucin n=1 Tax=Frankliniella fusca TaxID=407009 RepID=A0AAE1HJQ5_9NEOP|nr:Halomucin [Frankliniella fusca]